MGFEKPLSGSQSTKTPGTGKGSKLSVTGPWYLPGYFLKNSPLSKVKILKARINKNMGYNSIH